MKEGRKERRTEGRKEERGNKITSQRQVRVFLGESIIQNRRNIKKNFVDSMKIKRTWTLVKTSSKQSTRDPQRGSLAKLQEAVISLVPRKK